MEEWGFRYRTGLCQLWGLHAEKPFNVQCPGPSGRLSLPGLASSGLFSLARCLSAVPLSPGPRWPFFLCRVTAGRNPWLISERSFVVHIVAGLAITFIHSFSHSLKSIYCVAVLCQALIQAPLARGKQNRFSGERDGETEVAHIYRNHC